jgi:hypothetical protein
VRAASAVRCSRITDSNCLAWPKLNSRNKVPTVEGAYTPSNNSVIPPLRSRSMSSMQSAPAHIPAISVASFGAGFADPDLIRGEAMATLSANMLVSPVCSASVITGTKPATDTRLSSSNRAESSANVWNNRTESVYLSGLDCCVKNTNHPSSEGTFFISTHLYGPITSVD